jgi:2-hydroxy-3-keto-5-methylthiopentenyl-1-phosphate phosphatase
MAPSIRAVLSNLVGDEITDTIDTFANEVDIEADGKFRHPSRNVIST